MGDPVTHKFLRGLWRNNVKMRQMLTRGRLIRPLDDPLVSRIGAGPKHKTSFDLARPKHRHKTSTGCLKTAYSTTLEEDKQRKKNTLTTKTQRHKGNHWVFLLNKFQSMCWIQPSVSPHLCRASSVSLNSAFVIRLPRTGSSTAL